VPAQICEPPASADKGGQTLTVDWQVAVETDRPQGSAILFVSGPDTLLCFVSRSDDGSLGGISTGLGGHRGDTRTGLTLDSGMGGPTQALEILVGRIPTGTVAVRLGMGDGFEETAALGNGYYLAWLSVPAVPVRIDALDASGHLLARLADANGLQVPGSSVAGASAPVTGTPTSQGLAIGTPLLVGQQPGGKAALADTASGPVVSVYEAQVAAPGPLPLGSGQPVGWNCPPSPVGIVGTTAVTWVKASGSILALAGGASAAGPVGIGFAPDCSHMTVLAPATATSWTASAAPSSFEGGVWFFGMAPGDPQTVAAWSPATGQLAMKGGFLSWSSDGGHTWQSQTSPAIPAGWDPSGAFWLVGPGRLISSRGPGFSSAGLSVPVDLTWDPSAGEIPSVMATAVFGGRVFIGVRDTALESVAIDGSGTAHLDIAAWRISAGARFVAVEGKNVSSGTPTLAVSADGVHFDSAALPDEFATAPTDSVALLALDDRVLLTDWPQTSNPANHVIHVWSVPVTGAPPPPPAPTPIATPAIPSAPPAEVTSIWTPVTLPSVPSAVAFGGPAGGIAALPSGGFIHFVPASPTRTLVFTSPDGSHWSRTGEISGEDAAGITGPVAGNGRVFVALGSEPGGVHYGMQQNGAAWVSTDLRSWTKAPVQEAFGGAEFIDIAAGPDGFVATGFDQGGQSVWASSDGLRWSVLTDAHAFPPMASHPGRIVRTSRGLLIVGALNEQATVWTSPDGRRWSIHAPIPGASAVTFSGLAAGPDGYVTLGTAAGGPGIEIAPGDFRLPVVPFVSNDGLTWRAGPSSPALFGAGISSVVPAPGGFVATGTVGTAVGLWTSRDGLDWVPVAGVQLADADESTLVSDGHHVLLIASGQNGARAFVSAGVTR
jgi:hypothetical protein